MYGDQSLKQKTKKDMVRECGHGYDRIEINREDVHDWKNWRRNVIKRMSNPTGKLTKNR